jgi:hypothetical protein
MIPPFLFTDKQKRKLSANPYMNQRTHPTCIYNVPFHIFIFFSETTWTIETKLPRNDHWKVLYKVYVFYVDRKSKIAATAIHRLTLDPMGKCSNAFFSETTNIIKTKLYMNVHWMVLYKLLRFLFRYEIQNGGYGRT